MKRVCVCLLVLSIASVVSAATTIVVRPDDLAGPAQFLTSNVGWDWDEVPPTGVIDASAPLGAGSFYADVTGSAIGGGVDYTALRINAQHLFGYNITVGQLDSLSYSSNFVGGTVDWQVKIYTSPTPTSTSWYASRANYNRGNDLGTGWNHYSISSLGLSSMADRDPVSEFLNEEIMFIDIIAGYATNSPPSQTYLDNVMLMDSSEKAFILDLEPAAVVPVPGAFLLAGLGGAIVSRFRRKF